MTRNFLLLALLSSLACSTICHAAALPGTPKASASAATEAVAVEPAASPAAPVVMTETSTKAFSAVAVAVKAGIAGIGFDVATPLARRFNLRGDASFFGYNSASYLIDGMTADGGISFRSVGASVDYFPFARSTFHISPGMTFYNGNKISTIVSVATGQMFSLNDVEYISGGSTPGSNPISGTLGSTFGNTVAPSITFGFGDLLPRHGGHWSVPVEIGFQYIGTPTVALVLNGTACYSGTCTSVDAGKPAIDQKNEQQDLQNDLSGLRMFPIISVGVGYKF